MNGAMRYKQQVIEQVGGESTRLLAALAAAMQFRRQKGRLERSGSSAACGVRRGNVQKATQKRSVESHTTSESKTSSSRFTSFSILNVLCGIVYCSRTVTPRQMATGEGKHVAPRMLLSVDEFHRK